MPRLYQGPVELSETASNGHTTPYAGTTLQLIFRITQNNSDPSQNVFPTISVNASRVGTWHQWQQHEVWMNGYLAGTISLQDPSPTTFSFPVQPKILHFDATPDLWKVPQAKVNTMEVRLGAGGFGLNDSFDLNWIDFENVIL